MGINNVVTCIAICGMFAGIGFLASSDGSAAVETHLNYIVQARTTEAAAAAVDAVGGDVSHTLAAVHAVGAALTPREVATLRAADSIRVYASNGVVPPVGTR